MSAILANLPKPAALLPFLLGSAAVFWVVILALWGVETVWNRVLFPGRARKPEFLGRLPGLAAVRFALIHTLWITPVTVALSSICTELAKRLSLNLPPQELVTWLREGSLSVKVMISVFALASAPITEELIFRRFLFRAFHRTLPFFWAATVSALLFAAIHENAAVFIPIVFLGWMLAWLYRRTGRIVAPMVCHCAFNAINVAIAAMFPNLG